MRLGKLPRQDFYDYLVERLSAVFPESCRVLADCILNFTECHPYYSQQLAANVWQIGVLQPKSEDVLQAAVDHIVVSHALDYERLWMGFKRTNRWILQRLAYGKTLQDGEHRTSTIYSALKRLQKVGYAIYSDHYELEDPFFKQWILRQDWLHCQGFLVAELVKAYRPYWTYRTVPIAEPSDVNLAAISRQYFLSSSAAF